MVKIVNSDSQLCLSHETFIENSTRLTVSFLRYTIFNLTINP